MPVAARAGCEAGATEKHYRVVMQPMEFRGRLLDHQAVAGSVGAWTRLPSVDRREQPKRRSVWTRRRVGSWW